MSQSVKQGIRIVSLGFAGLSLFISILFGLYGLGKFARSQRPNVQVKLKLGNQTESGSLTKSLQSFSLTPDYVTPSKSDPGSGVCAAGKRLIAVDRNNVISCDLSSETVERDSPDQKWHFTKQSIADLDKKIVSEAAGDSTIKDASDTASAYSKAAFATSFGFLAGAIIFGGIASRLKK